MDARSTSRSISTNQGPSNETLSSHPRPDFLARMGHWETSIGAYTQYTAGKLGQPCRILGTFRCNGKGEPDTDGDWYCYPEPDRKWRECVAESGGERWVRNGDRRYFIGNWRDIFGGK